jgi:AcrR family transcriptional regulator
LPRKQREPSEVEAFKRKILENAVALINRVGFEGFTMRGLARMMGVTAPAIYSYYQNKDELYLFVLTEGFQMLFNEIQNACRPYKDPYDKLRAVMEAYVDFGLKNANFYNLMFIWNVPKYNDYVGTELEDSAHHELVVSQQPTNFTLEIIKKCSGKQAPMSEDDAQFYLLHFWCSLHGYIAGINNTLAGYMHNSPRSIKERMLDIIGETFQREMEKCSTGKYGDG